MAAAMDFNGEAFHFEKDGKCSLAAGSSGCRCANDVMVPISTQNAEDTQLKQVRITHLQCAGR